MSRADRDRDWESRTQGGRVSKISERRHQLEGVVRAEIASANVTGDEYWDHFLSLVQAKIVALRQSQQTAQDLLQNSDNFSPEALIHEKIAVRLYGKQIEALEWVISLPEILMEQGDRARELLASITENTD